MAHAQTAPGFDPRKTITPESFHVAPHLLGLPLASPSRRLAAILIDVVLCSILANSGKVAFALGIALAFFWFAGRKLGKGGGFFSRSARAGFRGVGALMLFVAAISIWNSARQRVAGNDGGDEEGGQQAAMSVNGAQPKHVSVGSVVTGTAAVAALTHATDSASAAVAARHAVPQLRRLNMNDAAIREALSQTVADRPAPVRAGVMAALASADSATAAAAETETSPEDSADAALRADPDSLAALYVAAVHAGDTTRADELRPKLASVIAHDSLDALRGQVGELREQSEGLERDKRELEREKKKAENRGLLSILLEWLDDLGIGIGWTGLYFTAFMALWKGQTPGKRLLGIRVLRLDGLPMTLWASFERFGGYAAGFFTGLLGFAQVLWDRNRQAIQDKISETVVIRETRGVPLPVAPAARPAPPRWPPAGVGHPLTASAR
ncbi:RDD family protein [Longimicrobium sp.]|uniref:RDD family protein n=1 Tax=Longimicrobium sp. TaxID=2029185 RepID=UPI002C1BBCE8|nr:RDD family protein [Longimicrobium sp.]HSU15577.1 RDD family protein [Longimicrobium sp.]